MPAMEPLCHLAGIDSHKLTTEENLVLEAILLVRLCDELVEHFRTEYTGYFRTMKFTREMENEMLNKNILRLILGDMLKSEEYSISGIAYYTQMPEEVISDVFTGQNMAPSLPLSRKIIDMHRTVRADFYRETIKRILLQYFSSDLTAA